MRSNTVQQVFNAVESAQEMLNDRETFDAHQTIIDDATAQLFHVQIGHNESLTVLGLIQKVSDIGEEWIQIQAHSDVLTRVVLNPRPFQRFKR